MASGTQVVVNSASGVVTVELLSPTVKWLMLGAITKDMPDSTPSLVAAAVIILGHAAFQFLRHRIPPAQGQQP